MQAAGKRIQKTRLAALASSGRRGFEWGAAAAPLDSTGPLVYTEP